jgi:hypothetical protein
MKALVPSSWWGAEVHPTLRLTSVSRWRREFDVAFCHAKHLAEMALPVAEGGFVAGALGLVGVACQAGWFAGAAELVACDADGIDLGGGVDARAVGVGVVGVGAGAAQLYF